MVILERVHHSLECTFNDCARLLNLRPFHQHGGNMKIINLVVLCSAISAISHASDTADCNPKSNYLKLAQACAALDVPLPAKYFGQHTYSNQTKICFNKFVHITKDKIDQDSLNITVLYEN